MKRVKFKVTLNGTSENPYERWGLTQNPFPLLPEHPGLSRGLAYLDATPMPALADLERALEHVNATEEFRHACRTEYRAGERVTFGCYLVGHE
jgi:hypothetical protein